MNLWYLDTSAAFKLLVEEAETKALDKAILTHSPVLSSCRLLETELRRTRNKYPELSLGELESFLASITIFDLDHTAYRFAGLIPGKHLRSLDAIHISAAMLGGCTTMVTYDPRMAEAAENSGLNVISPGCQRTGSA